MASEYIVTHLGDTYVVWPGLLVAGHQLGLQSIALTLVQAPSPDNGLRAICQAQVTTDRGTFTALADAYPGNAGRSDLATLLNLAQLRARSHALCDAFNLTLTPIGRLASPPPRRIESAGTPQHFRQSRPHDRPIGPQPAARSRASGTAPAAAPSCASGTREGRGAGKPVAARRRRKACSQATSAGGRPAG